MATRSLAAMEVPIIGSDSIQWIEVTVPSSLTPSLELRAPLTENAASSHIVGDPPTYIIWRIHKNLPHALELVELAACKESPKCGLRLLFQDALYPFAFICKNEIQSTAEYPYLLYTLTVSGVAYFFKMRNLCSYISGSIFALNEHVEFDVQTHPQIGKITTVGATFGCLVIGRHDGTIGCFQLGVLSHSEPGFMYELRDDVGFGRLWGLVARGRPVGAVQDLVVSELLGRKLVFVLHEDGFLRVWDLLGQIRVLTHTISLPESAGSTFSRLWVGDCNYDTSLFSLAVLYGSRLEADPTKLAIYSLQFSLGDKIVLSPEPSVRSVSLEEGRLIDLKFTSNKLWILKEDGQMTYDLYYIDVNMDHACGYGLQEAFVADQLFHGFEHASDDLVWASFSLLSPPIKDQVVPFVSSIFLRRMLQPGVHQNAALHAMILDHNKHLSDSEFRSLTVTGLKKEIFSIIESEGVAENPISVIYNWKAFCTEYFHYWCQNSIPYGLLIDFSTGAVGLIRKNSFSLFRSLEDIELLIYGSFDEIGDFVSSGLILPDDDVDCEILFELLRCISSINHQLGKAAAAVLYESLVSTPIISSEDVIPRLMKILETGYSSSLALSLVSHYGIDTTWEKELANHKSQRKFSMDMLLSFHALLNKATNWGRILDVVEKYVKYLIPHKCVQSSGSNAFFSISTSVMVQATSQVARVMLESAVDILLLLGYLVNISGQVHMVHNDISRIKLQLVPMIQEILDQWLILHLLGTTPSESPTLEDFSYRLSSLQIDNKNDERPFGEKLGKYDFTLACILLLHFPRSSEDQGYLTSRSFPNPNNFNSSVRKFSSWIVRGRTGEGSSVSCSQIIELATVLLRHGQYEAVENLLIITNAHSRKDKIAQSIQSTDGEWCARLHLLGVCLLVRAQNGLNGIIKERKTREAIRCFFRAASGKGACQALQRLSFQTGLPHPASIDSSAAWKLDYYQRAMQIFEQYNMSEGACQFALAALEQVDEVIGSNDDNDGGDLLSEPPTTIRGRLWANVFKFTLDLNRYSDAYCAIISNPDEDSKYICLRRFVIVLCERSATKVLCDGELPFVGLIEKVEQELVWKAERSDITANPNTYKLLYAFEMYRNNWRKAASYMYRYSVRLRKEATLKGHQQIPLEFQERLHGLSAAINALHLVHPAYAWIDSQQDEYFCPDQHSPNKRVRKFMEESTVVNDEKQSSRPQCCINIEKLEEEYILTSAQCFLGLANVKLPSTGSPTFLADLVDLLVQENLYDMAFAVLLKFWKGSALKRELERVFIVISQKCCPNRVVSSFIGNNGKTRTLLLTSSEDETGTYREIDMSPESHQSKGNNQWETLKVYLEKYKKLHPRLPVTVAEALLHTDPLIELPLWIVHMFKGGRRATSWGMTGQESDPATLFRLYIDYGRYTEATNLLLEYIESFASMRPADIINRKRMSAIWFPYTAIERLWNQLEELRSSGHMVDHCVKLKKLLHGALLNHLKQIKVDSDDALSAALG